ncbi:hypothetical protein, partial [Roseivivax halodurans]|uniref:hypothetical protein n=1 Tax=Roseivivax halodurans TaxID=93683 RepID=UPI001B7F7DA4
VRDSPVCPALPQLRQAAAKVASEPFLPHAAPGLNVRFSFFPIIGRLAALDCRELVCKPTALLGNTLRWQTYLARRAH